MLADGTTPTLLSQVDYTLISGTGLAGFFGVNGPFVDEATTPDAIGLSISGIDFALLLLSHDDVDYTAFTTSGGSASFVGVPDFTLEASSINVTFNSTSDPPIPTRSSISTRRRVASSELRSFRMSGRLWTLKVKLARFWLYRARSRSTWAVTCWWPAGLG